MMVEPLKILAVCNGGNCRSVAVAEVLKGHYGLQAISAGTFWLSHSTLTMLCDWADLIFPVEPFAAKLPLEDLRRWQSSPMWWGNDHKLKVLRVGPDKWGHDDWSGMKAAAHEALKDEAIRGLLKS